MRDLQNNEVFVKTLNARNVMGANPYLTGRLQDSEEAFVHSCLLNTKEQESAFSTGRYNGLAGTVNEFVSSRMSSVIHRAAMLTTKQVMDSLNDQTRISRMCNHSEVYIADNNLSTSVYKPLTASDFTPARLNSVGNFFSNQLTTFSPQLLFTKIRSLAFFALPMTAFGGGSRAYKRTGYTTEGGFKQLSQIHTTADNKIESKALEDEVGILDFGVSIDLNIHELITVFYGEQMSNANRDAFTGQFKEIETKFIGLMQKYMLALDNICAFGSIDETTDPMFSNIFDQQGVPHVNPTFPAGKTTFESLTANEMFTFIGDTANVVSRQSGGSYMADIVLTDLASYLTMMTKLDANLDSTPLLKLESQGNVQAIMPWAALDAKYPTKTSVLAYKASPAVLGFNVALPLSLEGYTPAGNTTELQYFFRSSGLTVQDALGVNAIQVTKS